MVNFLKDFGTPLALVVGSIVIALAVVFSDFGVSGGGPSAKVAQPTAPSAPPPTEFENAAVTRTENRNIYGSPDAPITIVEFSDFECPFCASLHPTLKSLVDSSNGDVNWEFRHLPLPNHKNARPAAIASECVARLAPAGAFWKFSEVIFANIGKADADFLKREAGKLGLTAAAYDGCIGDPKIAAIVDADAAVASEYGGSGTPYSLVLDNATKRAKGVSGAVPLQQWQQVLASFE